jgi:hypothetical protein
LLNRLSYGSVAIIALFIIMLRFIYIKTIHII